MLGTFDDERADGRVSRDHDALAIGWAEGVTFAWPAPVVGRQLRGEKAVCRETGGLLAAQ